MGVNGEINVVSLIDVMMLLMVIFMITAPMMQGGVDVSLPQGEVRPLEPKSGLVVTVKRDGSIFVDQTSLTYEEFVGSVKALHDKKGGGGVFVAGDRGTPWERIYRVIAAVKERGITDVGLVGLPEDNR
jgi:biopolymer transport protein ExbD/biopolymer transport protein TolR